MWGRGKRGWRQREGAASMRGNGARGEDGEGAAEKRKAGDGGGWEEEGLGEAGREERERWAGERGGGGKSVRDCPAVEMGDVIGDYA